MPIFVCLPSNSSVGKEDGKAAVSAGAGFRMARWHIPGTPAAEVVGGAASRGQLAAALVSPRSSICVYIKGNTE